MSAEEIHDLLSLLRSCEHMLRAANGDTELSYCVGEHSRYWRKLLRRIHEAELAEAVRGSREAAIDLQRQLGGAPSSPEDLDRLLGIAGRAIDLSFHVLQALPGGPTIPPPPPRPRPRPPRRLQGQGQG